MNIQLTDFQNDQVDINIELDDLQRDIGHSHRKYSLVGMGFDTSPIHNVYQFHNPNQ